MTFLAGLFAARSHLAILLGLGAAVGVVRLTSRLSEPPPRAASLAAFAPLASAWPVRPSSRLSTRERALAHAAWSYFEHNTDERTGLAASVQGYPSTTMWDVGSQLMAILAAEDLGVVSRAEASRRLERALASLAAMPLCERRLPNKAYDTRALHMVDYANHRQPAGVGWSALDIGRLFVPLAVILRRAPELTPSVDRVVSRFDLDALTDGAALLGATRRADGALDVYQEGRLGYEQYAARALLPWGVPAPAAIDYHAHAELVEVGGRPVPRDDRHPRQHGGAHAAVLSEPWVLSGVELGFDAVGAAMARAVLAAQQARYADTGKLTAVSEEALDRAPRFAYSAVLNGDDAWTAFLPDGSPAPGELTFSAKAAAGWGALFAGPYADRLWDEVARLVAPSGGIYAGRYDATGEVNRVLSLNTNAVVLEALAYRVHGPFLRAKRVPDAAEVRRW
ncbi:MAG: DUF3131 domain-containing protein [Anaeromyxobacteraceae bacterium]